MYCDLLVKLNTHGNFDFEMIPTAMIKNQNNNCSKWVHSRLVT
jgi:hypothetical protein